MPISRSRLLLLFVISLGSFMGALDNTIVNVSLPIIADYFGVGTAEVALVVLAYMLVGTSMVLLFGYVGDRVGYRKVFAIGFLLFVFSSLMCGLSGGIWELIGWRALQGLGEAMFAAVLSAMIFTFFPEDERTKALAIMVSMASLASVAGPVLGGLLTSYLSWHWVFFVNVPIGLIGAFLGLKVIPRSVAQTTGRFDKLGAVLVMMAMFLTVYYLNIGKEWGWTAAPSFVLLAGTILTWVGLVLWERRNQNPAMDVNMFKDRGFALGNLAGFLMMAVLMGTAFVMPFYFQQVKGMSVADTGLVLLVPAVAAVLFGLGGARLCYRFGDKKVALVSAGASALIGLLYIMAVGSDYTLEVWLVIMFAGGAAIGLFTPPCTKMVMARCSGAKVGCGSAINTTMRAMGMTAGVAIFEAILAEYTPQARLVMLNQGVPIDITGFENAFILGAVMSTIAFIAILLSPEETACKA